MVKDILSVHSILKEVVFQMERLAPVFDVIIPPNGGHGADIYRELGAHNVLSYARFENDTQNPDFITGNQFYK